MASRGWWNSKETSRKVDEGWIVFWRGGEVIGHDASWDWVTARPRDDDCFWGISTSSRSFRGVAASPRTSSNRFDDDTLCTLLCDEDFLSALGSSLGSLRRTLFASRFGEWGLSVDDRLRFRREDEALIGCEAYVMFGIVNGSMEGHCFLYARWINSKFLKLLNSFENFKKIEISRKVPKVPKVPKVLKRVNE